MLKRNQKGMVEATFIVALVLVLALGGFIYWRVSQTSESVSDSTKTENEVVVPTQNEPEITEPSIPEGFVVYENDDLSFIYPEDWKVKSLDSDDKKYGVELKLVSPETQAIYDESIAAQGFTEAPSYDLGLSKWSTINDNNAAGVGMYSRSYDNLEDFMAQSENTSKQKTGELSLNGYSAFEVVHGGFGASYGIMFEKDKEIFEFNFYSTAAKKYLTDELQTIIDSIQVK